MIFVLKCLLFGYDLFTVLFLIAFELLAGCLLGLVGLLFWGYCCLCLFTWLLMFAGSCV